MSVTKMTAEELLRDLRGYLAELLEDAERRMQDEVDEWGEDPATDAYKDAEDSSVVLEQYINRIDATLP